MRVLVATDGSDVARWSARRALAMLAPSMKITVLNVVPSPILSTGVPMGMGLDVTPALSPDTVEAAVRAAAAEVRATIADLDIDAEARVEQGDPGPVICAVAEAENFDLIVVGSHGSGIVKRLLVGSTSHHVLHHAPCPVLVVRESTPEAT